MAEKNIQIKNQTGDLLYPKTKAAVVLNNAGDNLGAVEAGAQVNKIEKIKVNGVELTIQEKAVNVVIPEPEEYTEGNGIKITNNEVAIDSDVVALKTDLTSKANANDVYTKNEIDGKLTSAMHYKGTVADVDALDDIENPAVGDVYNVTETGDNYAFDGSAWDKLAGTVDLSAYLTSETAAETYETQESVTSKLSNKVDKVTGKGLSTEDYTTAEKTKLANIAENAQVNVVETIKVNGTALQITDKAVNIDISGKANASDVYTKGEVDSAISTLNALTYVELA